MWTRLWRKLEHQRSNTAQKHHSSFLATVQENQCSNVDSILWRKLKHQRSNTITRVVHSYRARKSMLECELDCDDTQTPTLETKECELDCDEYSNTNALERRMRHSIPWRKTQTPKQDLREMFRTLPHDCCVLCCICAYDVRILSLSLSLSLSHTHTHTHTPRSELIWKRTLSEHTKPLRRRKGQIQEMYDTTWYVVLVFRVFRHNRYRLSGLKKTLVVVSLKKPMQQENHSYQWHARRLLWTNTPNTTRYYSEGSHGLSDRVSW